MATATNDWRNDASTIQRAIEWHANRLGIAIDHATARGLARQAYWNTARTRGFAGIDAAMGSRLALVALDVHAVSL